MNNGSSQHIKIVYALQHNHLTLNSIRLGKLLTPRKKGVELRIRIIDDCRNPSSAGLTNFRKSPKNQDQG